jgi:GT2 family glycosyltransferase
MRRTEQMTVFEMTKTLEVVICTFNRADDLDRCLERLALQDAPTYDWSVTVVDNNCTDHTPQVVAQHGARGRVPSLRRVVEKEQGLTPARRRGILETQAIWVAFVDDDCLVTPGWVSSAIDFARRQAHAAGFGGRVLPSWGRVPPPHLVRHGWLFAHQDFGDAEREVESLVGAGVVVNRQALVDCGWAAQPLLADRTGLGHASGGDVEISFRLATTGRKLWYCPSMRIDHVVRRDRQSMGSLMGLARGLGAGAQLVNLMGCSDAANWPFQARRTLNEEWVRHLASTPYVLTGRYAWRDWLIRASFLEGRRVQTRALTADAARRRRLAGVWAKP